MKIRPIKDFYKALDLEGTKYTQYVGIAIDEPIRLERLRGTNKISLLERFEYTERMAFDLCKEYDLVSPIYNISRRGGVLVLSKSKLFTNSVAKRTYPELWDELRQLSKEENTISTRFKYEDSFADADRKADAINARLEMEAAQLSLFDFL